jgi:uncharacterized protein with beta-barrel porin domain
VTGSTAMNGTVAPGSSIGTLTIAGNYTQNVGSTYEVEIDGLGNSDLIDVAGLATLSGGTVEVVRLPEPNNHTVQIGQQAGSPRRIKRDDHYKIPTRDRTIAYKSLRRSAIIENR